MKREWTTTELATMRRIAEQGGTRFDAAKAIDRTPNAVACKAAAELIRFRRVRGDERKGCKVNDTQVQMIMFMKERGDSSREVAETFGVSPSYVNMIYKGARRNYGDSA